MSENNQYIDNTLLRLRRVYSKEETVSALNKKLSEVEFNNGVLKSEVDELKHLLGLKEKENDKNLDLIKKQKQEIKASEDDFKGTKLHKKLMGQIKYGKDALEKQKNVVDSLYRRIFKLNKDIVELNESSK